ncbi:MAG TPA: SDR family oxidoreductase [Acidobacteriaceae bacterium]|jgi:hypothetical protein|nr:SDR family oxidoreductase [Acidobacteriaceae bacterium]
MPSDRIRKTWQGKWALVTGASAGIGEAIAMELGRAGAHLILTARRRERLATLAARLESEFGVETRVVVADLAQREAARQIFDITEGAGIAVDLLVNNAGFGLYDEFLRGDLDRQLEMVEVNCTAVVHLTRLFLPRMVERKRGDIMIVSSMASFQPVAYLATYAATKGFDRLLAEALAEEVNRYGIRVSALCPGSTESEFSDVAGGRVHKSKKQSAEEVARAGLEGLTEGRPWVIPFSAGRFQVFAQRLAPRRLVNRVVARMFRPPTDR